MQCAGWSFLFFTLRRQPEQQRCELRGVLLELRQLLDPLLGQDLALRRHIDKMRALAELIAKRHEAVVDGLSLHYHTCAAAVGRVIHTVMLIFRIIADIAAVYLDAAVLSRSADYAFAEHAEAHIGKES